jgi:ribosomal protein S18 acetylase RimI-like enzyme
MFFAGTQTRIDETAGRGWLPPDDFARPFAVRPLGGAEEREVLSFLAARPLHTVFMAGLIRDNGVESPLNRGTFYGCRDSAGRLEGVALIGHATLLETRTIRAAEAFAREAKGCPAAHMILGERERVAEFWGNYATAGREMRLACRELFFELKSPVTVPDEIGELRPATLEDLELVVPVQAEMARAESGVDPLETDAEGFRRRCARRIAQGRTWVRVEEGRLIFKAEVQSESAEVIYLEGVYVAPEARGHGLGLSCLSRLCRQLLARVPSVCLLVNEDNREAHALYRRAGFRQRAVYDTIFLQRDFD